MSVTLRAIILIAELVIFTGVCIYGIGKDILNRIDRKILKVNIIVYGIEFIIIFALFFFLYPSYIFFSISKLIIVSLVFLCLMILTIIEFLMDKVNNNTLKNIFSIIYVCTISISIVVIPVSAASGLLNIDISESLTSSEIQTKIKPIMFSENQIGYTADEEGNIKSYLFFYKDGDETLFKEIKETEVIIKERIKDNNTYVIEKKITKTFVNKERKPQYGNYIFKEENNEYKVYLNLEQMVEIKKDN